MGGSEPRMQNSSPWRWVLDLENFWLACHVTYLEFKFWSAFVSHNQPSNQLLGSPVSMTATRSSLASYKQDFSANKKPTSGQAIFVEPLQK